MSFHQALLGWYRQNRRDLPWRRTQDPYAIWVSEVMLQQTQVATVIPYWERWLQRWPTAQALAQAPEQEVLAAWAGLGYYRRCRLLHQGARQVAAQGLPTSEAEWRQVPGVGTYTAAAIASIAQNQPVALVDGNVERVYARLTADVSSGPALHRAATTWARQNLLPTHPGDWNQALMELGATVCTPRNPDCHHCPVSVFCEARRQGVADRLPTPEPKREVIRQRHLVWAPVHASKLGVKQIPEGAWWAGMWEFPREVLPEDASTGLFQDESPTLRELIGPGPLLRLGEVRHAVTHHRITIEAFRLDAQEANSRLHWLDRNALEALPMPAPQRRIATMVLRTLA